MEKKVELYRSKLTGEKIIRDGDSYRQLDGTEIPAIRFQDGELEYVMTGTLHKGTPRIK